MTYLVKHRLKTIIKIILVISFIAAIFIVTKNNNFQEGLHAVLIGVKTLGWLAPVVYIVIYNPATLLFIPGSILTMTGGFLFGVFWGSVYVLIGAMLGAILAFLVGRYLSRDWVSQQMENYPKFEAIDEAVKKEGWKIVLLTRLSPLFPFNLLNYAFGVTQVSLRDYVLGSLGIIPATVAYVYFGSLATNLTTVSMANQSLTRETQLLQWLLQGVGVLSTIAVTFYTAYLANKALKKHTTHL